MRSSAQIKLVCNASRMPVRGAFTRHCPRVAGIVFILIYSLRSRVSSRAPRSKNAQKLGSWRKSGRRHIPPFSFLYFPKNLNAQTIVCTSNLRCLKFLEKKFGKSGSQDLYEEEYLLLFTLYLTIWNLILYASPRIVSFFLKK